jgi:AraC-like DNA-binding protein
MASNSLAPGIDLLAEREGRNETRHPGVAVYRVSAPEAPTPTLYAASMILVGSGRKRGYLGDDTFVYDPRNYLTVTSPLPMICQTLASAENPMLTLVVEIDLELLRELLLDVDDGRFFEDAPPSRSVFRAKLTPELEGAGVRLLACLRDDRTTRALARQTIREMIFHVLSGPYGDALRSLARGPTSQLSRVMRHMNERYADRIRVEELARLAHMSVPTFHHHFKSMTSTSPLQYLKAIRLTRAKQMLQAGAPAKSAARDVGYESESQFSREFRRFFGASPSTYLARAEP